MTNLINESIVAKYFFFYILLSWVLTWPYVIFQHDYISNILYSDISYIIDGIFILIYGAISVYSLKRRKKNNIKASPESFPEDSIVKKFISSVLLIFLLIGTNHVFITIILPRYITLLTENEKIVLRKAYIRYQTGKECHYQLFLKGYSNSIFQHVCIGEQLFYRIEKNKDPIFYVYVRIKENSLGIYIDDIL